MYVSRYANRRLANLQTTNNMVKMNDFDFLPSMDALHPLELPVLTSPDVVLFPQILTPLIVLSPASLEAVEAATRANGDLIVVAQHNPHTDQPTPADVYTVGVRATVVRHLRLPDGAFSVLLQGYERVEIVRWLQTAPYPVALARPIIGIVNTGSDCLLLEHHISDQRSRFDVTGTPTKIIDRDHRNTG